jgi:hypothetical protein
VRQFWHLAPSKTSQDVRTGNILHFPFFLCGAAGSATPSAVQFSTDLRYTELLIICMCPQLQPLEPRRFIDTRVQALFVTPHDVSVDAAWCQYRDLCRLQYSRTATAELCREIQREHQDHTSCRIFIYDILTQSEAMLSCIRAATAIRSARSAAIASPFPCRGCHVHEPLATSL